MSSRRARLIEEPRGPEHPDPGLARWQRIALLAGAATAAFMPVGLGTAHAAAHDGFVAGLWTAEPPGLIPNPLPVPDAWHPLEESSGSLANQKAKTPKTARQGPPEGRPEAADPALPAAARQLALPAAQAEAPEGAAAATTVDRGQSGLTEAQAGEVAALLKGGLTVADVQGMTLDEIAEAARAAGISTDAVAAGAGLPSSAFRPASMDPAGALTGAGLLLAGGAVLWRRFKHP